MKDSGDRNHSLRLRARGLAVATAVALAAVAVAVPAGAAGLRATALTPAEQTFAKQYKKLIPNLNRATDAVIAAVDHSSKYTDAQVVSVFTSVARQWTKATKPLLVLSAPPQITSLWAAITHGVPAVEADLLAAANSGRTHNSTAGKKAGRQLALDFNALGAAVGKLKRKLSLP